MTTRPNVLELPIMGREGTAGQTAATTAFTRYSAISMEAAIEMDGREPFRALGNRWNSTVPPGKEWTSFNISGPMTYGQLPVLLSAMMGGNTGTKLGTIDAWRWTYAPAGTALVTPETFTVEVGSGFRMARVNHVHIPSLTFTFNRDGCDFTGMAVGKRYTDNPGWSTNTPGTAELQHILPEQISVYMDTAGASLGSTKLTRVTELQLAVTDMFTQAWFLNASNTSWDEPVNAAPTVTLDMTFMADGTALGLLTAARAGDRRFIRISADGIALGTTVYQYRQDLAVEILDFDAFKEDNGLYSIPIKFALVQDDTWGTAFAANVVNKAGTLGVYA